MIHLGDRRGCPIERFLMSRLTGRENQVLALIGRVMNCKGIAAELQISEFTVRKHRASILRKLRLKTTAQLTAHALAASGAARDSAVFLVRLPHCGPARSRWFAWSPTG
jgi:DNA-binding CsgD family transcriptional regulator